VSILSSGRIESSPLDRAPFHGASVLISGGTGSVGRRLVKDLLRSPGVARLTAVSRDGIKQDELLAECKDPRLHCVIDDVAHPIYLERLCAEADVVIHTAAIKVVHSCEEMPEHAAQTNVGGTQRVLAAAGAAGTPLVIGVSSDKAVHPVTVYGATKLLGERLFQAAGRRYENTRFVCVRLCNVVGSRGGIVAKLLAAGDRRTIKVTHPEMTRFFMSEAQVSRLIGDCAATGNSGEIFVPRSRSARIGELIEAISGHPPELSPAPQPRERLFEWLVGADECLSRVEPEYDVISAQHTGAGSVAGALPRFRSDSQSSLMSPEELEAFLAECGVVRLAGQETPQWAAH
jgi:UDP-N-acetylglucosamine 4,6-dehydratase/5-epimerase